MNYPTISPYVLNPQYVVPPQVSSPTWYHNGQRTQPMQDVWFPPSSNFQPLNSSDLLKVCETSVDNIILSVLRSCIGDSTATVQIVLEIQCVDSPMEFTPEVNSESTNIEELDNTILSVLRSCI
jgi:hypothetical protein